MARNPKLGLFHFAKIVPKILCHYIDVIMSTIASQITSLTIVYSTVYSGTGQRKHLARHWSVEMLPHSNSTKIIPENIQCQKSQLWREFQAATLYTCTKSQLEILVRSFDFYNTQILIDNLEILQNISETPLSHKSARITNIIDSDDNPHQCLYVEGQSWECRTDFVKNQHPNNYAYCSHFAQVCFGCYCLWQIRQCLGLFTCNCE